jgi:hypothetical protein
LSDDKDDEVLFVIPSTEACTPTRARVDLAHIDSLLHSETNAQAVITPTIILPVERLSSALTSTQEELIMEDGMEEEC